MIQYSRKIPVKDHYDVVVCGGGPSGCTAAVAARREGLKVLLVEGQAQLGGMATSGHVSHWLGGRSQDGDWVVGGLFRTWVEQAAAQGFAVIPKMPENRRYQPHAWLPWFIHGIPLDPFRMAHFLDRRMQNAGVDLLYETQAADVLVDDDRITHIITCNKEGLQSVSAAAVIDATGDADIAAMSGCRTQLGRESDGLMTNGSLMFHLYHVDHAELSDYIEAHQCPKFYEKIRSLRAAGKWHFTSDIFISVKLVQNDVAMMNMQRLVGLNGIDAKSRTEALIFGRADVFKLLDTLRQHFPGFQKAELKSIGSTLGVRETRRIRAKTCLKREDFANAKEFTDTIGYSMYGWDLSEPDAPNNQPLVDFSNGKYVSKFHKLPAGPIPYGIMVPLPIRNLLCPGRAVSVERDVLGPLRVMAPCMAMGEACGVAVADMVNHQIAAEDVYIPSLRERLRNVGAIVDRQVLPAISSRVDP